MTNTATGTHNHRAWPVWSHLTTDQLGNPDYADSLGDGNQNEHQPGQHEQAQPEQEAKAIFHKPHGGHSFPIGLNTAFGTGTWTSAEGEIF